MRVTISVHDTRFDGIGFTDAEQRDLVAQMFAEGVYTPDEYTSALAIKVEPDPAKADNANSPAGLAI